MERSSKYELVVDLTKSYDYSTIQFLLDGKPMGDPIDGYAATTTRSPSIRLATIDVTGPHVLEIEVMGKADDSSGYYAGVDAIHLHPVN